MTEKIPHNVRGVIRSTLTRRVFLAGVLALPAGCNAPGAGLLNAGANYGPATNEPFPIAGIDLSARNPELLRLNADCIWFRQMVARFAMPSELDGRRR